MERHLNARTTVMGEQEPLQGGEKVMGADCNRNQGRFQTLIVSKLLQHSPVTGPGDLGAL